MLVGLAQAQAHECHCYGIVLNGSLNTADFNGGVGYGAEYGGTEVIGYTISFPATSAFAFAHAQAFGFARSSVHGGHPGGARGRHGGGGHR
jgi:hypothetical protein